MAAPVRPRRSVLFVPGSNPRALEKSRSLAADAVIFDLEDAVAPEVKDAARAGVAAALIAAGYAPRELILRVNPLDTPWGRADLAAAGTLPIDAVLLPKVESAERAKRNPPMGTVLILSSSGDQFFDLRVHSYERSYDGIWATGGGFDGAGAAAPVERRSEAGDCRGIGTPGIIWRCGCATVRNLDGSSVHMAAAGSWVAGAFPVVGAWLHADGDRTGG